jgi:DNA repair exonuclease SbcCD ATPase subunit
MDALRKAAEQALEALEVPLHTPTARKQAWDAINALRAALAEQEQEPVADDALRLADELDQYLMIVPAHPLCTNAAAKLRRQHAEITALRAEVERLLADAETWKMLYRRAINEANGLTNYVEDRPELRSAERRLTTIEEDARAALARKDDRPPLVAKGCPVCGIGAGGVATGYACTRGDCPTRVTCGG